MTRSPLVLVTGTPRSGTTPVGDALAAAPGARTLYEPLNFHVGDRRVTRYFEVPGAGGFDEATADALVADIGRCACGCDPGIFPEDRGLRRAGQARDREPDARRRTGSAALDPRLRTLIWKDPFAAFVAARGRGRTACRSWSRCARRPRSPPASSAWAGRFDVADLVARLGRQWDGRPATSTAVDLASPALNARRAVVRAALGAGTRQAAPPGRHPLPGHGRLRRRPRGRRCARSSRRSACRGPTRRSATSSAAPRAKGPRSRTGSRAHGGRRDASAVNRYWVDGPRARRRWRPSSASPATSGSGLRAAASLQAESSRRDEQVSRAALPRPAPRPLQAGRTQGAEVADGPVDQPLDPDRGVERRAPAARGRPPAPARRPCRWRGTACRRPCPRAAAGRSPRSGWATARTAPTGTAPRASRRRRRSARRRPSTPRTPPARSVALVERATTCNASPDSRSTSGHSSRRKPRFLRGSWPPTNTQERPPIPGSSNANGGPTAVGTSATAAGSTPSTSAMSWRDRSDTVARRQRRASSRWTARTWAP